MSSDYHSTESGVGVRNLPSVKTPRNGLSRRHCCFGAEDAPAWRPGSRADGAGAVRAELLSHEMLLDSSVLLSFFLKFRFPPLTFGHMERSFGSSQGQTSFPCSPLSGAAELRASHTEGKTLPAERLPPPYCRGLEPEPESPRGVPSAPYSTSGVDFQPVALSVWMGRQRPPGLVGSGMLRVSSVGGEVSVTDTPALTVWPLSGRPLPSPPEVAQCFEPQGLLG